MANPEHLAILNKGIKAWNQWRERTNVRPLLNGACLDRRDFYYIEGTYNAVKFENADLSEANLNYCSLVGAKLREATLSKAKLRETDLRGADLSGSNLALANLSGTNLEGANLKGANLHQAFLEATIFRDTNLLGAGGLDTCTHLGPSTLDYRTILRSGRLSLFFLRGCGLADDQIRQLDRAQTATQSNLLSDDVVTIEDPTIRFYSCFISYSTQDQRFAGRLHADLQNNGVRCWFAPHDIQGGRKINEQIYEAIRFYDRLLLILSEHSMNSEWVKQEIAHARQKEMNEARQVLFPISLIPFPKIRDWKCFDADTGKDSAREIREYFIPDFSNWQDEGTYQEALQRLVRDLKAHNEK